MAVWVYYMRHHQHLADGYEALDEAIQAADYMNANGDASIEAVVDTDGTAYDMEGIWAYMRQHHPSPPSRIVQPESPEYREWNGQQWQVWIDWTDDKE